MTPQAPKLAVSSLLESLIVAVVFTLTTGITFRLLTTSRQGYRMGAEAPDTLQSAQAALDQVVRDIQIAGLPPASAYPTSPIATPNPLNVTATPFAWSPAYPATPCPVGSGCTTPSGFDLIIETDIDPLNNNGVEWVRYRLNGTTLERGVASKAMGTDPAAATAPNMVPFLENVVSDPARPVFTYAFDPGQAAQPQHIREVNITLTVQVPESNSQAGQPTRITLSRSARCPIPSQQQPQ